jgi:PAS domain S-box-containing protein
MDQQAKILIIDDDEKASRTLGLILEQKGYQAVSQPSGAQGVEAACKDFYNIVLLDVRLPDMPPTEVIGPIKAHYPDTVVIMVTAFASTETAVNALNAGASGYIHKPLDMEQVFTTITNALEKQQLVIKNRELSQTLEKELAERLQMETALRQHSNFLQKLIDTIPSPIYFKDVDGLFLGCNATFADLLARPREEIVGKTDFDIVPTRIADGFRNADQELFESPGSQEYEGIVPFIDGSKHDIIFNQATFTDPNGQVAGLVGVMTDITDRKNAEKERVRLATAIEQVAESVMITDAKGNIQYINPACEKISGYSRKQLIGQNPRILNSGAQDFSFYKGMWETLLRENVWHGHLTNQRKDGSFYQEDVTISSVRDQKERITNFVAVKRDITEELYKQKQLRQAQKMEAIGTLAGGIAHDFNNILAAIMGYAELTRDELPPGSQGRNYFNEVCKASSRAKELVRQILTISRQTEPERTYFEIHLIVEEAIRLLRSTIPSTIRIKTRVAPCGTVWADAPEIHQIIMNLCTNAFYAMAENGGTLEINLQRTDTPQSTLFGDIQLEAGPYIDLSVSDSGHGIAPELLSRIFDPYFTTKPKDKGTGLGLAMVHSIVSQYGGAIRVESHIGEGSSFFIRLPRVDHVAMSPSEEKRRPGTGDEHILLVDDEPNVVDLGRLVLTKFGYKVTTSTSSKKALEIFTSKPDVFDLVITDMTMPEMTGLELAKAIGSIRADIPIILCTGFSDQITAERFKAAGIDQLVMKPMENREMVSVVRRVLDDSNQRKKDESSPD